MADIRPVTPDFAVAPQLTAGDFAAVAAAGFKTVINNRPDGEAAGQMRAAEAKAAAEAAGLVFVSIPFSGRPQPAEVAAMRTALAGAAAPVLAYCRSGTRSITVWALAQAGQGRGGEIIAQAERAGYDLGGLRGALG